MKTATAPLPPLRSVKVLDQLRERIRYLHYSLPTEQAYVHWVRAFIRFHGVRHPATLGSSEVEAFLSWLANERKVSVSTHRQALAALLFFYGKVLCTDLPWLQEIGRPRPSRRLPVVLTPDEVVRILGFLEGEHRLFAQLLYGTGMRISEGLQLRVKDPRHDHRAGGQGLQGSGLDVTRELGTQPARAAVACTGMVAEGPGRGPQRRCASRRP
uniref:DNA integrase form delta 1 n=1 Tax=Klebsiella pneumoniae TaxID=573 RepID=Q9AMR2_KLEPN|nr:DNA integrase form delta 1 [Klebsiella pneumoniae]